jgi:hypothetical protein
MTYLLSRGLEATHARKTLHRLILSLFIGFLPLLLCSLASPAQRLEPAVSSLTTSAAGLPDAPQPQQTIPLSGTVADQNGAAVRDATVTVTGKNGSPHLSAKTNRHGEFHFGALPPGNYQVSVTGSDLQSGPPQPLVLAAGQARTFPIAVTRIPRVTSTVRVTASPVQIATAQVHAQEKQRVLGVVPNFYTSFSWDAAPMTTKLKYHLALRSLVDPFTIFTDAAIAGGEQYHDTYPGYGAGWDGYGKRFGATLADSADSRLIGEALLPSLFHQDPRYFYRGKGSFGRRLAYALGRTFACRGDSGREEVDYSHILGSFASAGISNVYHAPEDRSVGLTFRDGFIILGGGAAENVLREFISRGLTSHVPTEENGKP